MQVIDAGHVYKLMQLDEAQEPQFLTFVKREGEGYPGNRGHHPGTTMQEVLRAVVDRCDYVYKQIPDESTEMAKIFVMCAILQLERRAAKRHGRPTSFSMDEAVFGITCWKCNHVGCEGDCHQ